MRIEIEMCCSAEGAPCKNAHICKQVFHKHGFTTHRHQSKKGFPTIGYDGYGSLWLGKIWVLGLVWLITMVLVPFCLIVHHGHPTGLNLHTHTRLNGSGWNTWRISVRALMKTNEKIPHFQYFSNCCQIWWSQWYHFESVEEGATDWGWARKSRLSYGMIFGFFGQSQVSLVQTRAQLA